MSRPTWGPDETLVLIRSLDGSHSRRSIRDNTDILTFQRSSIRTEEQDVRLATFAAEVRVVALSVDIVAVVI